MIIGNHDTADRCYVIAEIALAHRGSPSRASRYIAAAAKAGADAVKFQAHRPDEGENEQFRVPIPGYMSRADYWEKTRLPSWEQMWEVCQLHGVDFLCSPFYLEAVDELNPYVPAWKVASGEVTNVPLVEKMVATGKPLIVSMGLLELSPREFFVSHDPRDTNINPPGWFAEQFAGQIWLDCESRYPCQNGIFWDFEDGGLSDHSGDVISSIAAIARGAEIVEVHLKLDDDTPETNPDCSASVTQDQLSTICKAAKSLASYTPQPPDEAMQQMFMRGIYAKRDLKVGDKLTADSLCTLKPRRGICASRWHEVLGKTLRRDVPGRTPIEEGDIG